MQLMARSRGGLELFDFAGQGRQLSQPKSISSEVPRQSRLSANGRCLAYALADEIVVCESQEGTLVETCRVAVTGCADFTLSPSGCYLAVFEKLQQQQPSTAGNCEEQGGSMQQNLKVWRIDGEERRATCLGGFTHKTQATWMPQWTSDEKYLARMVSNEVQFYKCEALPKVAFRIHAENIGAFSISPGPYPKAAIFVREAKAQPGAVRIFLLPNTSAAVAQKCFFRADRCTLLWSPSGRHLLAMAQTEVDSTGVSYYGETNLYFVSGDGSFDCHVSLDKEGPIHDVAWSPRSDEFVVLYGYMPAKAMLFDNKCNGTFEFPVGSKNHVRWNPQGSLVAFGGFGNLPGHVEIWSRSGALRRVGHFQSQGASVCEWAPDGAHLVTGTLTPRLRVDNCFRIWSWRGEALGKIDYGELYAVGWRAEDAAAFPLPDVSEVPLTASGPLETETAVKKSVYRPPGLRNSPTQPASAAAGGGGASPSPAPAKTKAAPTIAAPSTLSKEERAARKLKEKLDQIVVLRQRRDAGETLELNQLEKIEREGQIRKEYETALAAIKVPSALP